MLGFPIVGDTMYGGGDPTTCASTGEAGGMGMDASADPAPARAPTADAAADASVGAEAAAEALCVCCTRGEAAAFSEEQLRRDGIMLHALRYDFLESSGGGDCGAEITGGAPAPPLLSLEVQPPAWC